jgi:hypothetical protein
MRSGYYGCPSWPTRLTVNRGQGQAPGAHTASLRMPCSWCLLFSISLLLLIVPSIRRFQVMGLQDVHRFGKFGTARAYFFTTSGGLNVTLVLQGMAASRGGYSVWQLKPCKRALSLDHHDNSVTRESGQGGGKWKNQWFKMV